MTCGLGSSRTRCQIPTLYLPPRCGRQDTAPRLPRQRDDVSELRSIVHQHKTSTIVLGTIGFSCQGCGMTVCGGAQHISSIATIPGQVRCCHTLSSCNYPAAERCCGCSWVDDFTLPSWDRLDLQNMRDFLLLHRDSLECQDRCSGALVLSVREKHLSWRFCADMPAPKL